MTGDDMHDLCADLWRIPRSLTGPGNRETLEEIPLPLNRHSVPSGSEVFDWTVPPEFTVHEAWIEGPDGVVCDWRDHRLHLVGYSEGFTGEVTREELDGHLYSLPDQPDVIPYVTSYYGERDWGFCLRHSTRENLPDGTYRVTVDAEHFAGQLDYADLVIPGQSSDEVLVSTYICHPQQANDGLSGIAVQTALARWLMDRDRRYTYRFVFVPETIGSIAYLSEHLEHMKKRTVAGFVATTCGDEGPYTYLQSRTGDTLADRVGRAACFEVAGTGAVHEAGWGARGSDERQYCSPGADLPVVSLMRSKHGTYPEYHTSADDLEFISPEGLAGSLQMYKTAVDMLERNRTLQVRMPCEPKLDQHGLYPSDDRGLPTRLAGAARDVVSYCDGETDTLEIAGRCGLSFVEVADLQDRMRSVDLIRKTA